MVALAFRQQALKADKDKISFIPLGIKDVQRQASIALRKVLTAFRKGNDPILAVKDSFLAMSEVLRDAMTVAYMYGMRRSRLLVTDRLGVAFSVYVGAEKFIGNRLSMTPEQLDTLKETFEASAVQVMSGVTPAIEQSLQNSIGTIVKEGMHVREGIQELEKAFIRNGLHPRNSFTLEAIMRTQTQIAYQSGRYAQDQDPDIQEILWGYRYVTVGDTRVRDSHALLDGVTLPKDNVFWEVNWPPNGWACRCQAIPVFEERIEVHPSVNPVRVGDKFVTPGADPGFRVNFGKAFEGATTTSVVTHRAFLERNAAGLGTTRDKRRGKRFWQNKLDKYYTNKGISPPLAPPPILNPKLIPKK